MMTDDLFSTFQSSSKADWLDQVAKELKGKDAHSAIQFSLWDRVKADAYYGLESIDSSLPDSQLRFHPESEIPGLPPRIWSNMYSVYPDSSNESVLRALSGGADGLVLHLYGVEDLISQLQGVLPQYISLLVKPLGNPIMALRTFLDWVVKTGCPSELLNGGFLWSPSDAVFDQNESFELGLEQLEEVVSLAEPFPRFKAFALKSSRYSESGGNPIDSLAWSLGELIDIIDKGNLPASKVFESLFLEAGIGEVHFGEISRIRSFRLLVSELSTLYGLKVHPEDLLVLAQTADWSKSLLDSNTNLIRQTYEAMAGVLGGANFLWVKTIQESSASEQDRRIALNVSTILKEEAYLDRVMDPVAGAYLPFQLTQTICQEIKNQLQIIEEKGGWLSILESGFLHQSVRAQREEAQLALLESKFPKIGVNRYPAPNSQQTSFDFDILEEKGKELKPTRAAYLCELQSLQQP